MTIPGLVVGDSLVCETTGVIEGQADLHCFIGGLDLALHEECGYNL